MKRVLKEVLIWLRRAEIDLKVANAAFKIKAFADCVYHCEQAVQKLMKGVLILFGIRSTEHRVASLFYEKIILKYPSLEKIANIAFEVEKHWLKTRYPLETKRGIFDPLKYYDAKKARKFLRMSKTFLSEIKKFLKRNLDLEF